MKYYELKIIVVQLQVFKNKDINKNNVRSYYYFFTINVNCHIAKFVLRSSGRKSYTNLGFLLLNQMSKFLKKEYLYSVYKNNLVRYKKKILFDIYSVALRFKCL